MSDDGEPSISPASLLDSFASIFKTVEEEVTDKKRRAPVMSPEELFYLSQNYVENYEIFHGTVKGASRESSLMAKSLLLNNIATGLIALGYPKRTTTQIEQRIRDNLKKSREFFTQSKKGNKKVEIPPHIKLLLDRPDIKARLLGGTKNMTESQININNSKEVTPLKVLDAVDSSKIIRKKRSREEEEALSTEASKRPYLDIFSESPSVTENDSPVGDDQLTPEVLHSFLTQKNILKHEQKSEKEGKSQLEDYQSEELLNIQIENEKRRQELLGIQIQLEQARLDCALLEAQYWKKKSQMISSK